MNPLTLIRRLRVAKTERLIELNQAFAFLNKHYVPHSTLEVGNVLHQYTGRFKDRIIIDRYEQGAMVRNFDVMDYTGCRYDCIISISTIEHVRFDYPEEHNPAMTHKAIEHLRSMLTPQGHMLVTVPVHWNVILDWWLASQPETRLYQRTGRHSWEQCSTINYRCIRYGFPHPYANGVFVYEV